MKKKKKNISNCLCLPSTLSTILRNIPLSFFRSLNPCPFHKYLSPDFAFLLFKSQREMIVFYKCQNGFVSKIGRKKRLASVSSNFESVKY